LSWSQCYCVEVSISPAAQRVGINVACSIRAHPHAKKTNCTTTRSTAAIRGGKTAPFVVDAFGAFGAEADQLLHWLGDGATSSHAFDTHADFMDTAYAWLSVAIQVGNAELADKVVARMRSSAIHRA